MWQSPNQRLRALANAKKRERERLAQPLHFRRVPAEIQILSNSLPAPVTVQGRAVLNDMTTKMMGVFTPQAWVSGTEVMITIMDPNPIQVRGRIVACQEFYNASHILSPNSFNYRLTVKFSFKNADEEKMVKDFVDDLHSGHLYGNKAA